MALCLVHCASPGRFANCRDAYQIRGLQMIHYPFWKAIIQVLDLPHPQMRMQVRFNRRAPWHGGAALEPVTRLRVLLDMIDTLDYRNR